MLLYESMDWYTWIILCITSMAISSKKLIIREQESYEMIIFLDKTRTKKIVNYQKKINLFCYYCIFLYLCIDFIPKTETLSGSLGVRNIF